MSQDVQSYPLYSAEEVRNLDHDAITTAGIPGFELMKRAGEAAFRLIQSRWPGLRKCLILCGPGKNGGDGYILAARLIQAGYDVLVYASCPANQIAGDARKAMELALNKGVRVRRRGPIQWGNTQLVVDALLGTGISRKVRGKSLDLITQTNKSDIPVLSVDIPSGIHPDTGQPMGSAVKATVTLSFVGQKKGLFTGAGREYAGTILFDRLGIPDEVYNRYSDPILRLDASLLDIPCLAPRPRYSHKGQFGHVLIIGGDTGMPGSVQLSALAALRAGAGLVTVATRAAHASLIPTVHPEVMCHGVESSADLKPLLDKADVLVIGPGMGLSPWSKGVFNCFLRHAKIPSLVDAGGLRLLADAEHPVDVPMILTPHPGEMACLLRCNSSEVEADRYSAIILAGQKYRSDLVLKGAGTLMTNEKEIRVCDAGNPGMSVAGMGDLLTGLIAGLIAQGCTSWQAVQLGVLIHAVAADEICHETGEKGMMASDMLESIRCLVNRITRGRVAGNDISDNQD
ncbi:MAG: NAD(P)H-hydrate dehydratase [Gammaproteobacteria bacterium]|nr:MAG: NAD(P)H-hydrate dehydratase [Gammaproteobacteria bacterium]